MGCSSVYCGISNITIYGRDAVLIPIIENTDFASDVAYVPLTLPIFGRYGDYINMDNIIKDENTTLIESFYNCNVQDFCDNVTHYEYPKHIQNKISDLKNVKSFWVDREVWDYMSTTVIYPTVRGRYCNPKELRRKYSLLFGTDTDNHSEYIAKCAKKSITDIMKIYDVSETKAGIIRKEHVQVYEQDKIKLIYEYLKNKDTFESQLKALSIFIANTFCSGMYLHPYTSDAFTPQCGEYEMHQQLLEKFTEINKSYIYEEDEEY